MTEDAAAGVMAVAYFWLHEPDGVLPITPIALVRLPPNQVHSVWVVGSVRGGMRLDPRIDTQLAQGIGNRLR